MNLLDLAGWVAGSVPASAPAPVRRAAVRSLVDTMGVSYAGASAPEVAPVLEYVREYHDRGPVPVPGTDLRLPAEQGALALGLLAHALDYDDSNAVIKCHPSAVLWSAILAAGCCGGTPGRVLVDAYIAGFQILGRIGRRVGDDHYSTGWHNTSTLGTLAAAAAAGRVLGLTEAAIAHALGIAASMASGLRINFGTPTKPLHCGLAARNGVLAALLSARGMRSNLNALWGSMGFGAVLGGEPLVESDLDPGDDWEVLSLGVDVKPYPCCAAAHRSMEAARAVRDTPGFVAAHIQRVECLVHPHVLTVLVYPRPVSGLQAKFSLEYCVAAMLLDGRVGHNHFTDAALGRPEVTALAERVQTGAHPELTERAMAEGHFAEVRVYLDGESTPRVGRCDVPTGDARRPLPDAWLEEKFLDCTRVAGSRAREALALLWQVEEYSASDVLAALATGMPPI